jgi:CTP:molybdopterin cytidylyltransferase MocA
MSEPGSVAGLVLAAGAGTRMGTPKGLLRTIDGTAWVSLAVTALAEGGCAPIHVVTGAAAEQVARLVPALAAIVPADEWEQGMSASLRAGLRAVQATSAAAVVVTLVDTPGVTAAVVARLTALARSDVLARAAYDAVAGHPVLIGREHWAGVIDTATGDVGARQYLARHNVTLVEAADAGCGADFDQPADREEFRSRSVEDLN